MEYESNHRKLWIVHPYDEEYYDSFCFSVEGLLPNHGIICHDKIIFRCYCCRCCSSIFCGRNSLHFETNKHRKNPDKSWLELKRFQHFSSSAIFHFSTRFSLPVINKPFSFGGKKWMLLLWFALFVFRSKLWWMVMLLLLSRVATVFGPHTTQKKKYNNEINTKSTTNRIHTFQPSWLCSLMPWLCYLSNAFIVAQHISGLNQIGATFIRSWFAEENCRRL